MVNILDLQVSHTIRFESSDVRAYKTDVKVKLPPQRDFASNLLLLSPASLWGVLINSVGAHRCDEFRQTLGNGFRAHHKLCDPSTYASLAFEATVQTPKSIHSTSGYVKTPIS